MITLSSYTADILRSLRRKHIIAGKHTEEKNCFRRIKNLSADEQHIVYKEWAMCINEELILRMKKTGEWHVSLNPRMLKEIMRLTQ